MTQNDGGTEGGAAFRYNLWANEGTEGSDFHKIAPYDGTSLTYSASVGEAIGSSGAVFTVGRVYTFKLTASNEVGDSESRYPAPITRIALGSTPA